MRGHFPLTLVTTPPLPPWPNLTFQSMDEEKVYVSTWTTPVTRGSGGTGSGGTLGEGVSRHSPALGGRRSQRAHGRGRERNQRLRPQELTPSFKDPLNPTQFLYSGHSSCFPMCSFLNLFHSDP